jgi:multimeric flavodoxin WrbA
MKIVVVHGQTHKGSTYHVTACILQALEKELGENAQVTQIFLPADTDCFCVGCYACFERGEQFCPHADTIQPIVRALLEADLLVFESPCYVLGMSGQLKALLDHMAYLWMAHRPDARMFSKIGLAVSTAAGMGAGKTTRAIGDSLLFWGVAKTFRYGVNVAAKCWEEVAPKRREKVARQTARLAQKIARALRRPIPGARTKAMFCFMRSGQKSNAWNPTDRAHWEENGWLRGKNPW